jgi:CheY-like chemotaxis protein
MRNANTAKSEKLGQLSGSAPKTSSIFVRSTDELLDTFADQVGESHGLEDSQNRAERVVLVDDDHSLRRATQVILEDLGYEVVAYANALDALQAMVRDHRPIALLVTDYDMPGLTGFELAKMIRAERPEIPILLSSGWDEGSVETEIDPNVKIPFLQKPYTLIGLAHKIREILNLAT